MRKQRGLGFHVAWSIGHWLSLAQHLCPACAARPVAHFNVTCLMSARRHGRVGEVAMGHSAQEGV